MAPLVPCPECSRHVRADEGACPFCASALPEGLAASAVPECTQRLPRAALMVFAATLAAAGCDRDRPRPTMTPNAGAEDARVEPQVTIYGGPPGPHVMPTPPPAPVYGGPPIMPAPPPPSVPAYGAVPPSTGPGGGSGAGP